MTTGMGAVATVALVDEASGTVAIGHVGDSRGYLLRDGEIEQLTRDHSLVAELVESGVLTPEEAEHHPQRSAITRALGTEPEVEVDAFTVDGRAGDVFLLCSDGLSAMVADEALTSTIEAEVIWKVRWELSGYLTVKVWVWPAVLGKMALLRMSTCDPLPTRPNSCHFSPPRYRATFPSGQVPAQSCP